jgi:hypothetical protein
MWQFAGGENDTAMLENSEKNEEGRKNETV